MTPTPIARSLDPNPEYRVSPTRVLPDGSVEMDGMAFADFLATTAYCAAGMPLKEWK